MQALHSSSILGTWRLTAAYVVLQDSGERQPLFGAAPRGIMVFTESGRMMALLADSGRHAAETDIGRAELFRSMMSYSGRFRLEDDRFVTSVDLAWEPSWEGSEQSRFYTVAADRLTVRTAVIQHPGFPGRAIVGHLEWARER